jgi:GNAT superfamily N-acetyltransferase
MRAQEFINETINPDILDSRFNHTQEIGDYIYTAKTEFAGYSKVPQLVIRCYDGADRIGEATFYSAYGDSLVSALTTVHPKYRKQGIASTMYAYARMLGNTIEPSKSQLPPGKKMWKSWKKSGDAEHLMKEDAGFTITLNQLYQGDFPDRDEAFWDEVRPSDFDKPIAIQTMARHMVQIMLLSQYRAEHLDDIADMMDEDQQEVVQRYMNDPALSSKVIVVSGGRIIDGNHRALAAAFNNTSINYVDLADLDEEEEEIDEAELGQSGWGETPKGTNVDYEGLKVQMRPSTFLKLAAPLEANAENPEVAQYMEKGGKIAFPWLDIAEPVEWEDGDFSKDATVRMHEGRNRMKKWIQMKGDEPIQVNLFLKNANRRRFITDGMIEKLSQGMFSESGPWVNGPLFNPGTAQ